jgi:subtilisin family serine protease
LSGTSMATPHVSGVAALVWSHFPTKSAFEIRTALESTADDLGTAGRDNSYGYGLVNAKRAYDFLSCMPICRDSPLGWYDIEGPTYSCSWYSRGKDSVNRDTI